MLSQFHLSKITFETGNPEPEIKWYKAEEKIKVRKNDNKCKIYRNSSDDCYILEIQNATADDNAKYTVKASNDFGSVKASAKVEVVSCEIESRTTDLQMKEEINLIQNVQVGENLLKSAGAEVSVEPVEQVVSQLREDIVEQEMERCEIETQIIKPTVAGLNLEINLNEELILGTGDEKAEINYTENKIEQKVCNAYEVLATTSLEQVTEVDGMPPSALDEFDIIEKMEKESKELHSVSLVSPDVSNLGENKSVELMEDRENESLKSKTLVSLSCEETKSEKDQALETEVHTSSKNEVGCPPVFVVKPKPVTVQVGQNIQLQCKVEG